MMLAAMLPMAIPSTAGNSAIAMLQYVIVASSGSFAMFEIAGGILLAFGVLFALFMYAEHLQGH